MIKRKRLNDVYMREVTKSKIKTVFNKELNSYITYKHSIETSSSVGIYVNGERKIIFDKGYSIIEYSPLDEEYNVRVFIDDKGNILQYYFDVIEGIEYVDGEVYYKDLYLDILYHIPYFAGVYYIELADEGEFIDAHNKGEVSDELFDHCYKVAEKIMKSLKENNNRFVNRGLKDYLDMKEN